MPTTGKSKIQLVSYRHLKPEEISDSLLVGFTRFQETTQVLAVVDGKLIQKEDHFIDAWKEDRLVEVSQELRTCTERGGIVVGAFLEDVCVGFTAVQPDHFGLRGQYVEMTLCHVTQELRGNGIGKKLFNQACETAKIKGIEKIYLSTHPSIESQGFYHSAGCVLAEEINPEILAREPLDIQLEKRL